METATDTKKGNSQISFRAPELKERLETIAREKGLTLAEYVKSMCEASLEKEPAKPTPVKSKLIQGEANSDFVVLLKENNEKHDQVIDLLGKLVETSQPAGTDLIYTEDDHNSALGQALIQQERELRKEHLLIRLTEDQQNVINKLLAYRKEKGKIFSGSVEELFFYVLKDTMYSTLWNTGYPEFDTEFKNAFAEYFEQIKF